MMRNPSFQVCIVIGFFHITTLVKTFAFPIPFKVPFSHSNNGCRNININNYPSQKRIRSGNENDNGHSLSSSSLHSSTNDDDSKNSETTTRIQQSLNDIGRTITQNKNNKEINLELVSLGQKFNSFRKRFDYLELLHDEIDRSSTTSNNHHYEGSLWVRNDHESDQVEEYIQAVSSISSNTSISRKEKDELSAVDATTELHIQSFQRIQKDHGQDTITNQEEQLKSISDNANKFPVNFQIKTIQGISTSPPTDLISNKGDSSDSSSCQNIKVSWEGNKHITEYNLPSTNDDDDNNEQKVVKVERYLVFDNNNNGGGEQMMKMIVNSTIFSMTTNDDIATVIAQCQETFYPITSIVKNFEEKDSNFILNKEQIASFRPLQSNLERVPGCIANVNIYTTLIPTTMNEGEEVSYRVLVDGETDTLLSRGLLSVLSTALSKLSVQDVLDIEPYTIADELYLRSVLSAGRNDGLSNMVSIVQNQIKSLMEGQHQKDKSTGSKEYLQEELAKNVLHESQTKSEKPTVAVLLSGGVDSAVALNLLCQQNYSVTAFYLKIWLEDELAHLGQCPWEDDYNTCIEVCKHAGDIPLEAISLQDAYKERVISYTIEEAKKGRTPNPDIMCNSRIKFGCFYDAIADRGFDYVASGHYAQLQRVDNEDDEMSHADKNGVMKLLRAPDPVKDQSYFLAALRQDQLKRVLFPIGHLQKPEVRALAEEFDLPNKSRPDSQGLCFLGKVKFDEFLAAYLGKNEGDIVDAHTGEIIGRHNGIWYHTVGQRKGIGKVLNPKATSRGPWYVVAKDPEKKKIIASNKYDEEIFHATRSEFYVEDIRWISGVAPNQLRSVGDEMKFMMKIRHGPTIVEGTLQSDTMSSGTIHLEEKDGGLAPGQFVAFYVGMECLGSAVISEKHWLKFKTDVGGNEVAYQQ